jgi:hypothetical protein
MSAQDTFIQHCTGGSDQSSKVRKQNKTCPDWKGKTYLLMK